MNIWIVQKALDIFSFTLFCHVLHMAQLLKK